MKLQSFHCAYQSCNRILCKYEETDQYAFELKCPNSKCKQINYRGNVITANLMELRCPNIDEKKSQKFGQPTVCNKLLGRILPGTHVVIRCPRCGAFVDSYDVIGGKDHEKSSD